MRLLPAPDEPRETPEYSQAEDHHGDHRSDPHRRPGPRGTCLPDRDDLICQIRQLNGLVAMGMIAPAQANVLQRGLRMMLDECRRQEATTSHLDPERLADFCRDDPSLLELFEPLLTEEQFAYLFAVASGGPYPADATEPDEAGEDAGDGEPGPPGNGRATQKACQGNADASGSSPHGGGGFEDGQEAEPERDDV